MTNCETIIASIVGHYGEEEQLVQTAEEASELAKAALKRRKALTGYVPFEIIGETRNALAEEIADVLIMIDQLLYVEGFEEKVNKIKEEKLRRQVQRMKGVSENDD